MKNNNPATPVCSSCCESPDAARLKPPTALAAPPKDTPFKHSFDDRATTPTAGCDSTIKAYRDRVVAAECFGTIFSEVEGFVEAIYPVLPDHVRDTVLQNAFDDTTKTWLHWPQIASEANVFAWLERLQSVLTDASAVGLSSRVVFHGHLVPSRST